MSRRLLIPALLLALCTLCACGASDEDGGVHGRNFLFTRTASDEEVFREVLGQDGEDVYIHDDAVPLAGLPASVGPAEGWILMRYARNEDGVVEPLWYRVWTEEGCWSQQVMPYTGSGWHPELPTEPEVRPLG